MTLPSISHTNRWIFMDETEGQRVDKRLEDNAYILGQLAEAKERARLWKRRWTREVMKDHSRTRVSYTAFEMDHAEQESGFWHDTDGVIVRES